MAGISTHKYEIVKSVKRAKEAADYALKTGYFSHDFETNAQPIHEADFTPTMLGWSIQPGYSYVVPLDHFESKLRKSKRWKRVIDYIGKNIIENPNIVKICFNLKFEYKIWLRYGYTMRGVIMDAMIGKYLLNEERPNDLGSCVNRVLGDVFTDYKDDTEELAKKYGWANIPIKELSIRNALDTDLTLRLMLHYERKLIDGGFYPLFRNLTMPLTRVLAESEYRGIDIDPDHLLSIEEKYSELLEKLDVDIRKNKVIRRFQRARVKDAKKALIQKVKDEIKELRKEGKTDSDRVIINRMEKIARYVAGDFGTNKNERKAIEPVNFNSPQQMWDLFFFHKKGFKLKPLSYSDAGNPSTGEEDLLKLKKKEKTGFIDQLLKNRELEKLKSTYIDGIIERLGSDSRIHAGFLIHGTVTGRLSSRGPNLQNIPRVTTNADIKPLFIPPPGYLLLEADYSQAELRIMAEWANEEVMIEWFKTGKNVHVATACKMFNEMDRYDEIFAITKNEDHPEHEFWMKRKKKAKTVNFGVLYGETAKKLAGQIDSSVEEAQEFMDQWFETFPRISRKIKQQHKLAHKNGFIVNWFGRKRRLPAIWDRNENFGAFLEAQRQSVNAFTQGTSSDFTQFSSVLIRGMKLMGKLPPSMEQVYTVHDSIGYIIKPKDIHKVAPIIYDVCSNPETKKYFGFELKKVYMGVNIEIGKTWAGLRGYDKGEDYSTWIN